MKKPSLKEVKWVLKHLEDEYVKTQKKIDNREGEFDENLGRRSGLYQGIWRLRYILDLPENEVLKPGPRTLPRRSIDGRENGMFNLQG